MEHKGEVSMSAYTSHDSHQGFAAYESESSKNSTLQHQLPTSADAVPDEVHQDMKRCKDQTPEKGRTTYSVKGALMTHGSTLLTPLTDQTGSAEHVMKGLCVLSSLGAVLGIIMPKDPHLPTAWYRLFSSILGYT